jgi:hypothetical protein
MVCNYAFTKRLCIEERRQVSEQHAETQKGLLKPLAKPVNRRWKVRPTLDEVQKDLTDYAGFLLTNSDQLIQVGLNENIGLQAIIQLCIMEID